MIWLTWRQHRIEALVGLVILAVLTTLLLATGFAMSSSFQQSGLAQCVAVPGQDCGDMAESFQNQFRGIIGFIPWLNFLPLLVGLFVGAPMVARELEQGTHRLVFSQSITRFKWLGIKLGLLVSATLLASIFLTAVLAWWHDPLDRINGSLIPSTSFDLEGTVPLAYALFALALGIAAGTLLGRTVAGMAVTLAAFIGIRLAILNWRPYFLPAQQFAWDPARLNPRLNLGDWNIDTEFADSQGHPLSGALLHLCQKAPLPPGAGGKFLQIESLQQCMHDNGFLFLNIYHPASQFWTFQALETAIYVVLAAALLAISVWWVQHRIA